jgi:hypothetical protein
MELFLIDAIGPFFRGYVRSRVNWSKIPFMHLVDASPEDWLAIEGELRGFARQVSAHGTRSLWMIWRTLRPIRCMSRRWPTGSLC